MKYVWVALAFLLAIAAGATWFAFSNPEFVYGLTAMALSSLWAAFQPELIKAFKRLTKRKSPEEEAIDRAYGRMGQIRPSKRIPHPGDGGRN